MECIPQTIQRPTVCIWTYKTYLSALETQWEKRTTLTWRRMVFPLIVLSNSWLDCTREHHEGLGHFTFKRLAGERGWGGGHGTNRIKRATTLFNWVARITEDKTETGNENVVEMDGDEMKKPRRERQGHVYSVEAPEVVRRRRLKTESKGLKTISIESTLVNFKQLKKQKKWVHKTIQRVIPPLLETDFGF